MTISLERAFRGAKFLIVPGHYDFFGGAERQSLLLASELLTRYECHVDFLGWGGDGVLADEVKAIGCRPFVFPLNTDQRGIGFATRLFRLARYIRNEIRPDYLLPYVGAHCKVIGSIWKRTGARFSWWNQRDEGRLILGTVREHKLLHSLPAVVSNSFEGRDFLVDKFSMSPEQIKVINNGIMLPEPSQDNSWRHQHNIGANETLFAMIANLSKFKDHATLLRAFAILKSREAGNTSHLVLAGRHGETAQSLKALAFDLNLCGAVHFPGGLNPSEVQSLLKSTDIVVHSSVKEGCPNGALEAMAQGICVLGTNISGMRQALGEQTGLQCLAAAGDAEQLAGLMSKMMTSPAGRMEIGQRNRQRIATEFSVPKMAESVLETVLEHRIS